MASRPPPPSYNPRERKSLNLVCMYVGINLIFMHKKSQELGGGVGGEQKERKLEICERGIGAYFTKEEFCIAFCKQNPLGGEVS